MTVGAVRNDRGGIWNDNSRARSAFGMTVGSLPLPSFCRTPPLTVILRSAPPPCHSEERTTKNLRCWLTRRLLIVMGWPSEGDFRFLTAVRNDSRSVRNDSEGRFGMTLPPRHSEARTPKNLRCWLTRRLVIVMGWPSEGDFRFLTAVRNDSRSVRNDRGAFGMTVGASGTTIRGLGLRSE